MSALVDRLVFVDLETGGLEPHRPIIQAAAVAVDASLCELESVEVKVRFDEQAADAESLRKNSYKPKVWEREALVEHKAARLLRRFLRRHAAIKMVSPAKKRYRVAQLVAHNAAFDGEFLRRWYDRLELFLPTHPRVLCTVQRAVWLFLEDKALPPPADFKLGTLCDYFGVTFPREQAHDALADVRATVQLYRAMSLHRNQLSDSNQPRGEDAPTEATAPAAISQ